MSNFKVSSSDAPEFGATKTKGDFPAFFDDFADFAATAGFEFANVQSADLLVPEWGDKGRLTLMGYKEGQYKDENRQMWGILRKSTRDHKTAHGLVGKHRGDFAGGMIELAKWALGDVGASKDALRNEIDALFDAASTIDEMALALLAIDRKNEQLAQMPTLDDEDTGAYAPGELRRQIVKFFKRINHEHHSHMVTNAREPRWCSHAAICDHVNNLATKAGDEVKSEFAAKAEVGGEPAKAADAAKSQREEQLESELAALKMQATLRGLESRFAERGAAAAAATAAAAAKPPNRTRASSAATSSPGRSACTA